MMKNRIGLSLSLLLIPALVAPGVSTAQKVVELPATPTCKGCRITFRKVASLDELGATRKSDAFLYVRRDGRGRYYVANGHYKGSMLMFDSSGTPLKRLGRQGRGPGEYSSPYPEIGPGDTIYVFDGGRLTVLDPDSLSVLKTAIWPQHQMKKAILPGHRFAVCPVESNQPPLAIVDSAGNIVQALVKSATDHVDRFWSVANSGSDGFWGAQINSYRLHRWDQSGASETVFERRVPWFVGWGDKEYQASRKGPKLPQVEAVKEDDAGRLWVLISVPKAQAKPRAEDSAKTYLEIADYDQKYESIIEVIDWKHGVVLLSQRFPILFRDLPASGYAYSYRETESGESFFDVWRLDFLEGTSRAR
jgi:hypothetical protein